MSLQTIMDDAKAILDKATADYEAAKAAVEAAVPHLNLWAEIEAEAVALESGVQARLLAIVARAKALF